jgi:hypothetical protein
VTQHTAVVTIGEDRSGPASPLFVLGVQHCLHDGPYELPRRYPRQAEVGRAPYAHLAVT